MTIIRDAEYPFKKGECPMCGSKIHYTTAEAAGQTAWRCPGCGGYGCENQTDDGRPLHQDLVNPHGVSVVLLESQDLEDGPLKPECPRSVLLRSDYSPETTMRITMTEDGDVIFKIRGPGEVRIATSGGAFHGQQLAKFCEAARVIMEVAEEGNK